MDRLSEIKKVKMKFNKWMGKPLENTMGNKEVLDVDGEPLFAELAYLRYLKERRWEGVWINNWLNKFQNKMPLEQRDGANIPLDKLKLLTKLWEKNGGKGGMWDIFAWKDDKILFCELKRIGKDQIRDNQIKFYQLALELGFNKEDFIIIEWELN